MLSKHLDGRSICALAPLSCRTRAWHLCIPLLHMHVLILLPKHFVSVPVLQNEGLVPWSAKPDVLIDRDYVRSLLDIYVAPDPQCVPAAAWCCLVLLLPELGMGTGRSRVSHLSPSCSTRQLPAQLSLQHFWSLFAPKCSTLLFLTQGAGPPPAQHQGAGAGGAAALRGVPVSRMGLSRLAPSSSSCC